MRQRLEDIPWLLEKFIREAAKAQGREAPEPDPELVPLLRSYSFPGNVRELRAMVFEAMSLHKQGPLGLASFRKIIGTIPSEPILPNREDGDDTIRYPVKLPTLKESADLLVEEAMRRCGGNQTRAARLLGISRPALSKRLNK